MIRYCPILILALLLACSPARAIADGTEDATKKDATAAMLPWLGEIDAGDYAKSWSDSAQFFHSAITSDKWVAACNEVRTPLGKSISRQLASALLRTVAAGGQLPAGTDVIAQFDSSFENLKAARETVSFQKESDGVWRAVGYFIKTQ